MAGKIVLPGGSGYLGQVLASYLVAQGKEVVILSRHAAPSNGSIRYVAWDGKTLGDWAEQLEGAEAVINLAGRTVNCRYNERNRQEIYDSRLHSTAVLGQAISRLKAPPPVWINSSSATIYRHAEDRPMDEQTGEIGTGFSVDVCQKWEKTLHDADTPHTRKVALRTAMVFGRGKTGVCEAFYRVVKRGLGGNLGTGRQYVSWVHTEDFCRAVQWSIDHPNLQGAINCASPNPITNRKFMATFRREMGVMLGLPAACWMLEVGAFLLQTETELLLKSRRVVPTILQESGFKFQYPDFESALRAILNHPQGHGFD